MMNSQESTKLASGDSENVSAEDDSVVKQVLLECDEADTVSFEQYSIDSDQLSNKNGSNDDDDDDDDEDDDIHGSESENPNDDSSLSGIAVTEFEPYDDNSGFDKQTNNFAQKPSCIEFAEQIQKRQPLMQLDKNDPSTIHLTKDSFYHYQHYPKPSSRGLKDDRSKWGNQTNLVDENGRIQRVTSKLRKYVAIYKSKYFYYFDLVNGRYPQFVRRFENGLEVWRMSFNVYASGFNQNQNLIAHLGEIHAFYQMELINNQLCWMYKDFNFYPNRMRFGIRISSYDIADINSHLIKFVCLKENLLKDFPYANVHHRTFIRHKFEENLQTMKNRLNEVNVEFGVGNHLPIHFNAADGGEFADDIQNKNNQMTNSNQKLQPQQQQQDDSYRKSEIYPGNKNENSYYSFYRKHRPSPIEYQAGNRTNDVTGGGDHFRRQRRDRRRNQTRRRRRKTGQNYHN